MSLFTKKIRPLVAGAFAAGLVIGVAGTGIAASLGSSIFPDVTYGSFDDAAIGEMYSLGVINGYDNGKFGPNDPVTRGQLAVMLKRFRDTLGDVAVSSSSRANSSAANSSSSSVSSKAPYGSVRFTAGTFSGAESGGNIKILAVRTGGATGTVNVEYSTTNGSAVAGTDYTETKGTLTFASNETSKSFTIPVSNNPLPQGNKTFTVTLANISAGAALTSPSSAVVTITDNQTSSASSTSAGTTGSSSSANPAGTFNLSATAYMMSEDAGSVNITVLREGGSTGTVGVAYGTSNGTATSGTDYSSVSGTLTFNGGETSKTISIPLTRNTAITGNKAFTIIIGTPTGGASLGRATSPVTIVDVESGATGSGVVKFTKEAWNVSKNAGYIDVLVQRIGSTSASTTVNFTTTPLSAAAGVDYVSTNGTVNFAAGEATKPIRVAIYKTTSINSGKSFSVDLSGVSSNATLSSPSAATVTIDN